MSKAAAVNKSSRCLKNCLAFKQRLKKARLSIIITTGKTFIRLMLGVVPPRQDHPSRSQKCSNLTIAVSLSKKLKISSNSRIYYLPLPLKRTSK